MQDLGRRDYDCLQVVAIPMEHLKKELEVLKWMRRGPKPFLNGFHLLQGCL